MTLYVHPRPPFIFVTTIQNHESIKAQLMPDILSFYHEHKDDEQQHWNKIPVVTNYNHQSVDCFTDEIKQDLIWNSLDLMFHEMNGHYPIPSQIHLTSIWWNVYTSGSYANSHDHRGYDLSGVYFLHMNEPNTLVFEPDSSDSFFPWTTETFYTNDKTTEGSLVLFPSSMKHYVTPVSEMRITISFNLICNLSEKWYNGLVDMSGL
jgi:uncharacterized protein (TIGR02466 family)